ncbi:MAG: flagellar motor switch protein FliN [Gammaproteobacteria bacterium]|nr:flagellar motor switch protein FliN [Gammaproteobacteria bacterium]
MSDEDDIEVTESADDDWASALEEQADTESEVAAPAVKDHNPADALNIQKHEMEDLDRNSMVAEKGSVEDVKLDAILDIPVHISMEIGRTQISIRNLLKLNQGSVVELDRLAGEPMDVLVNGTLIARGEVVVVNEKFGLRLTDIISPADRVKHLR